jgi:hypothetical protein
MAAAAAPMQQQITAVVAALQGQVQAAVQPTVKASIADLYILNVHTQNTAALQQFQGGGYFLCTFPGPAPAPPPH